MSNIRYNVSMIVREKVNLAPYTTFGIGGPADYFITASTQKEITKAVSWANEKKIQFFILGTGANILVADKGYRGLVIKNEAKNIVLNGSILTAESGAVIADLINYTQEKGLSGLEHFAGIPSSVGGALWQNLHFLSPDRSRTVYIGDLVTHAKVLPAIQPSPVIMVDKDYFEFGYDYSKLHDSHDIVLEAIFSLTPEDPKVIKQRIEANLAWRQEKHPTNAVKKSAGSIFKKLDGYGAGRLIEQVGLKGKIIGGAKISDKHANFILNENNATAKDVRDLIDLVQKTVKDKLNLEMQSEISFVGEF